MPIVEDLYGRRISYLRLSITDRCNLRCVYCMPPQGVPLVSKAQILSFQEIERICRVLVPMGVRKIRVTGGEPLVRRGVLDLLKRLRAIPGLRELCLTTNGILLEDMADDLKKVGVDRINVSLDSLDAQTYAQITSFPYLHQVLRGMERALVVGFSPLKVNMVVMRGVNHHEVLDFVELARETPLNVRFIEYMPFGEGPERGDLFCSADEIMDVISSRYELEPLGPSGPARDYRVRGFKGWVGFISPVSHPFCGECNRLRITAKGEIRPCLLWDKVVDVKGPMRRGATDGELVKLILDAVALKPRGHGLAWGLRPGGVMAHIGG